MFQENGKGWKLLAVIWLLFISVLFFLPGSALPKEDWLDKIYFDKWVHVGFFAVLLFLWKFYLPHTTYNLLLVIAAFIYGFCVELIQHYWVVNRSFDLGDLLADMIGTIIGIWLWSRLYIKK